MEPQLFVFRIGTQSQSSSKTFSPLSHPHSIEGNDFTGVAKWDVNHPFHLAMLGRMGILQTYTLETTGEGSKVYLYPCGSFQVHLDFEPSEIHQESEISRNIKINNTNKNEDGIASLCLGRSRKLKQEKTQPKAVEQAWGSFEFIPGCPQEIIFFQDGSSKILFSRLPGSSPQNPQIGETSVARINSRRSKVYCVGRHSSTILSIAIRGDGLALVSAARDGSIRIWRISDGSMLAQTMFSRWRQPRSPRHGKNTKLAFNNHNGEVEMDQMSSNFQVLSFMGNSWDLYMGCPNGEVRIWSMMECESNRLKLAEVGNSMVSKDMISSIALHVPNCNFPVQGNNSDNQTHSFCPTVDTQEFFAIGTVNQNLQVWSKQIALNEWFPLWSNKFSIEGASIVSLSFRVDGGLLAVAVSRSGKPLAINDCPSNQSESSSQNRKQLCDRLYLYNTSSWACEGWLSFTSHLGSCLFYLPHFTVEDKNNPRSSASQVKVSSCRLLLVSTSSGPQTHILPEFGLFGSNCNQCDHPICREKGKNVQWSDLKKGLGSQYQGKFSKKIGKYHEIEGEGDGSGSCGTSSMPMDLEIETKSNACFSGLEIETRETSPRDRKKGLMVELSNEQIGLQSLRKVVFQEHKSQHQSSLPKIKTKMHPRKTAFKESPSNLQDLEANLLPRGQSIKKQRYDKELPGDIVRQNRKQRPPSVGSQNPQKTASTSHSLVSFNPSFTWLHPYGGEEKLGREKVFVDPNDTKVEETQTIEASQALPAHSEERVLNRKVKKEVTFTKPPEVIPSHIGGKTPSLRKTISHSRKKGVKGRLGISKHMKSLGSKKGNPKNLDQEKTPCQHTTKKEQRSDLSGTQSCQRIGGRVLQELLIMNEENSPFKNKVQMGGTFREISPLSKSLVVKSSVVPLKNSQEKSGLELNRPVAFSTANLMQKLQDLEQEAFDLDAAFQVAKAKGIVLSKHDREEIKAALEEEGKIVSLKCEADVEGPKPSARYIPLLKIPDPRISYNGPFVAPRKVRKQPEIKGEDMRTIQPALFDLWNLDERCPQVSSANLEQPNTFSVTSWRRALGTLNETNKNSVWVQREDVCRAVSSAQAVYDNCLYWPDSEPPCHCYEF